MVISFLQNWLIGTGSFTVGSGTAKNRMVPPLSTQSSAESDADVAPVQTITWSAKLPIVDFFEFLRAGCLWRLMLGVAPNFLASSSLYGLMSATMMFFTPLNFASWACRIPAMPLPIISSVSFFCRFARRCPRETHAKRLDECAFFKGHVVWQLVDAEVNVDFWDSNVL